MSLIGDKSLREIQEQIASEGGVETAGVRWSKMAQHVKQLRLMSVELLREGARAKDLQVVHGYILEIIQAVAEIVRAYGLLQSYRLILRAHDSVAASGSAKRGLAAPEE